MTYTLCRTRAFIIPYLIILCLCFFVKAFYTREEIYFAINTRFSLPADDFFKYYTFAGDGLFIVGLTILLAAFSYRSAFLMISSFLLSSLVVQLLKRLFDAPRPILYFKNELAAMHFVNGVKLPSYHSFPSGHTVTAFSAAFVATYVVKNKSWGFAFLLVAAMVGFSRMYLSAHFFEDVIAGSVVGLFITLMWISWIDRKPFLHSCRWTKGLLNR